MKALLLNSGTGSRMGLETKDKPKCMVKVSETETILSRQIRLLLNAGITEFVITIGPFEDVIPNHVKEGFPNLSVTYVRNEVYDKTNYIYSMYLAKEYIQDDFILLHGDIVLEDRVLPKLLSDQRKNLAVIDSQAVLPEKDFKCVMHNGYITEIGINPVGKGKQAFLLPVYKLSREFMEKWLDEIHAFVEEGTTTVYAENAFNRISAQMFLETFELDGMFCMEVDTLDDLAIARGKLA